MPLNEFWNEEPNLFWAYRFCFYQKKVQERDEINFKAWLHGAYVYEAVSVALNNSFSKSKLEYSSEPRGYEKPEDDKNKKEKQIKLEEMLKARAKKIEGLLGGNKKDE